MSQFIGSVTHTILLILLLTLTVSPQDAAVVNPEIVNVQFENERVRILRTRYAAHERLDMHSHPAMAEVKITDGLLRIFTPDGKWRDESGKAGAFFWLEPSRHAVENVGNDPLELVEIEMKSVNGKSMLVTAPSHSETTLSNPPVPVEQEPHHRWEFQNAYVRVLEVLLTPGEVTLFHTHSHDSIAVQLTPATVQEQSFGKERQPALRITPGEIRYAEGGKTPYTHRVQNVGSTPFHVVDIELLQ